MVKHIVLLKFKPGSDPAQILSFFKELRRLKHVVPGLVSFFGGEQDGPRRFTHGYSHGFVMTFKDTTSRDTYLAHPAHRQLVERYRGILAARPDAVLSFDFSP